MKSWFYAKPRRVFRVLPIALDAAVSTLRIAVEYTGRFVLRHELRAQSGLNLTHLRSQNDRTAVPRALRRAKPVQTAVGWFVVSYLPSGL
jgi:hypothetical protein